VGRVDENSMMINEPTNDLAKLTLEPCSISLWQVIGERKQRLTMIDGFDCILKCRRIPGQG
jgi:hypothetical protein